MNVVAGIIVLVLFMIAKGMALNWAQQLQARVRVLHPEFEREWLGSNVDSVFLPPRWSSTKILFDPLPPPLADDAEAVRLVWRLRLLAYPFIAGILGLFVYLLLR